jgi:uncharacterized membrane protein HdeD (DUF308 family)
MKKLFKSLIKIIYVVVLPIAFILASYYLIENYDVSASILMAMLLIGICIVANAVMYLVFMSKVKMLPKIYVEILPIFGFAFGVDPSDNDDNMTWVLLIPFVSFEFRSTKR